MEESHDSNDENSRMMMDFQDTFKSEFNESEALDLLMNDESGLNDPENTIMIDSIIDNIIERIDRSNESDDCQNEHERHPQTSTSIERPMPVRGKKINLINSIMESHCSEEQHSQIKRERNGEESAEKNSEPSCQITFDERINLPEFFTDNESSSKSAEIYLTIKNHILFLWSKLYQDFTDGGCQGDIPYISATACRSRIGGDANAIIRVHRYLEDKKMINHSKEEIKRENYENFAEENKPKNCQRKSEHYLTDFLLKLDQKDPTICLLEHFLKNGFSKELADEIKTMSPKFQSEDNCGESWKNSVILSLLGLRAAEKAEERKSELEAIVNDLLAVRIEQLELKAASLEILEQFYNDEFEGLEGDSSELNRQRALEWANCS
mmetsp:Transcript_12059/g.18033  ORF Transcript_12059/g.18033 Transcript_12059/m.18033 type:complete len:381 (+) Transcript_12059:29-1171(+)|eukprot:CAMPEP_0171451946 /NCGR_PEP_ID=MMETSP0945-20130129/247_1 /TAXON_ID=109269 /ORGANISM="Vaucheria litorea, Strain CCMP2940" /LENGTH=380 /DNA_ID=CAMNT_0011976507 /DNA_START=57 /DNA_END=1199 /DNA_ORIENTATION=+